MSQLPLFVSGLELANLVVSTDLPQLSWKAIQNLYREVNSYQQQSLPLRFRVYEQSNCTIIAFVTSPICTKDHLQGRDLVSSATLKEQNFAVFDFLCSTSNPSFSIHSLAIALFARHFDELSSLLKSRLHGQGTGNLSNIRLILTGHSLGGSIASLFTLWLLGSINELSTKPPPICITFGSPLIGDQGLQRAISEFSKWNSCFLHIAACQDPVPGLFISAHNPQIMASSLQTNSYKPFGSFLLCSESGCTCVDDPEVVSELLQVMGLENTRSQISNDEYGIMVERLKSGLVFKSNSQLGMPVLHSLQAGIILQLEAIGDRRIQQQQQHYNINNLIQKWEQREKICVLNKKRSLNKRRKLNEIKIKMAYMEWYKKECKAKGIGYYDSYKNQQSSSDMDVTKHKKYLTNYWKELIEEAERKPQKEMANMRVELLYAGTNYRRMVEPLDIAEYYRENGKRDYQTHGRSKHYILLEKWQKEDANNSASSPTDKKKKSVAGYLTEDSCFWAKVEDARISCTLLKNATSSNEEKTSSRCYLTGFEQSMMDEINKYAVSPEIFLGQSSFMKWWNEFEEIMETSHNSPLVDFMKNNRYEDYARGCF